MALRPSEIADLIKPFVLPWIEAASLRGGAGAATGGDPSAHALSGALHTGLLDDGQAPQFLLRSGGRSLTGDLAVDSGIMVDGVDISAHAANANAHHATATEGDGIDITGQVIAVDSSVVRTSRELVAGAGLTGGGTLAANRTFAVGAGLGITVNADDVALTTPGTLSVGSANSSSGSHTHAIVSSSAPEAAARILASDVNGYLTLVRLGATELVRTPLIDTAGGSLTLQPVGDLVLDPVGNDVLPATGYDINLGMLTKKYLTLHAAELWVETLVAQNTIATIGGRVLIGPTTTLTRDLSNVAMTIYVKHNQMASGDRTYMEADGKVEFFAITSGPTTESDGYSYSVTRNLDGTGANLWYAGDAMFNTGTTGKGWIDLYSIGSMKLGSAQYGPTIVGNVRNSATFNDWGEAWAIGNLNGLYGYGADTPGVGLGQYASGKANIVIDPTNGFRLRSYTTDILQIKNSDGKGYIVGPLYLDTAGGIYQGTGTFASPTTGLKIWNDAGYGRIGGYNAAALQWYAGTDGKLYAGGGAVWLDATGATVQASSGAWAEVNAFSFAGSGAAEIGGLYGRYDGSSGSIGLRSIGGASRRPYAYITADGVGSGAAGNGLVYIAATNAVAGKTANITLDAGSPTSSIVLGAADFIELNAPTTIAGKTMVSKNARAENYYTLGIEVVTGDNTPPGIGFHRSGYGAVALYERGEKLFTRTSGGTETQVVDSGGATFSGNVKIPSDDGGLEVNAAGGVKIYTNEINVKDNGHLYLGYRNTAGVRISGAGEHRIGQAGDTYSYHQVYENSRYRIGCYDDTSDGGKLLTLNEVGGNVTIGASDNASELDINGYSIRIRNPATKTGSAAGSVGTICWDSSYLYVCTASNTWKRAALSSF